MADAYNDDKCHFADTAAYEGYLLYSPVDKDYQIQCSIAKLNFLKHQNIFIIGVRCPDIIRLIQRSMTAGSTLTLVEIENDESLQSEDARSCLDEVGTDPRVSIIVGNIESVEVQITKKVQNNSKVFLNLFNVVILSMPYAKSRNPAGVQSAFNAIMDSLYQLASFQGNAVEDILWGIDNYVNNWGKYLRGLHALQFQGRFRGTPCIIVGAGPSLDKSVYELAAAQRHAMIFAVDAALDTLLNAGIVPDAVFSVERTIKTLKFYKEISPEDELIFVGPNVIQGKVLERFNRIIHTGRKNDMVVEGLTRCLGYESLDVGMNVAHAPYEFAKILGCDPIIATGLDLAYKDGKTHTRMVAQDLDSEVANAMINEVLTVAGKNGETLETLKFYLFAKKTIEKMITENQGTTYINSTDGGANIIGMKNQALSETIQAISGSHYDEGALRTLFDEIEGARSHDYQYFTDNAINYFKDLKMSLENLISSIGTVLEKIEKEPIFKRIQKIIELNDELVVEAMNPEIFFIEQSVIVNFYRNLYKFPIELEVEEEEEIFRLSERYFCDLRNVSRKVIESIDVYIEILQSYSHFPWTAE